MADSTEDTPRLVVTAAPDQRMSISFEFEEIKNQQRESTKVYDE